MDHAIARGIAVMLALEPLVTLRDITARTRESQAPRDAAIGGDRHRVAIVDDQSAVGGGRAERRGPAVVVVGGPAVDHQALPAHRHFKSQRRGMAPRRADSANPAVDDHHRAPPDQAHIAAVRRLA